MKAMSTILLACATLSFATPDVQAQSSRSLDTGKLEYDAKCVVCHGRLGQGDGSYGDLLRKPAADLTRLQAANGGVFPRERVFAAIAGADSVHDSEMPAWGKVYSSETAQAAEYFGDMPYDQQMYVSRRIGSLLAYIEKMQR